MNNAAKDLLARCLNPSGPFGTQVDFQFDVYRNRKFIAGAWRTIKGPATDHDKARLLAAEEKRRNRRMRKQPGT